MGWGEVIPHLSRVVKVLEFFEKIFAVFGVKVHIPIGMGFDVLGGPRRSPWGWRLRRCGFEVSSPRHGEQGTGTVARQGPVFFYF